VIGVEIEDFYDGFSIILRDEESGVCVSQRDFDQEDSLSGLVDVFNQLGIEATYSEVY